MPHSNYSPRSERDDAGRRQTSWWALHVLRDRTYRALVIALFLLGVEDGLLVPYIALWVTQRLHGTTLQAALVYVPFGLVVVATGFFASAYSDRVARRRGIIILSLAVGCAARAALAFVTSYPFALALYAVTGFGPLGIIYALLRDTIRAKHGSDEAGSGAFITSLVRTVYSVGWLAGPVLGGVLVKRVGFVGLFIGNALLLLLAAGWSGTQLAEAPRARTEASAAPARLSGREVALLGLLFAIGLLLLSGDAGRASFLSLYLTSDLRYPISAVSWMFSVAVFAELFTMPLAGRLADRFGVGMIFVIGIAVQALYFFAMSAASAYWLILLLQVSYALVVAANSGVAISFAQRTIGPQRTALATSSYFVSRGLAPIVNGALLGVSLIAAHLARLFVVFGVLSCAALGLAALMSALRRCAGRRMPRARRNSRNLS